MCTMKYTAVFLMLWAYISAGGPGALCRNVAYAQNGHRNVLLLFSKHTFGFIKNKLGVNMCAPYGCSWMCLRTLFPGVIK